MKRFLDLLFALIMIIVLSPVLIIMSLIIKTTSKGSVFFKQNRIGLNKSEFQIFKFRTMYVKAPKDMPTHMLLDPEEFITPIGKVLRKTSLDELPQLFNIIKGDMSFIGPRPALYNQYDLIELRDQYNIHKVKPGISGWAQVNGRDELEIPVKVEYDRYYVEHQSIGLDMKIIFMTIFNVLFAKGVVEGKQKSNR